MKFFYFEYKAPDALISSFRSAIERNTSMFRLMPMVDAADLDGSFSVIYDLKNDGSPNKLRDVRDIAVDSYELSKFLGQLQRIVPVVNDGFGTDLPGSLVNLLSDSDLLMHYTLWERLFMILLSLDAASELLELLKRIDSVVGKLQYVAEIGTEPKLFDGWNRNDAADAMKGALIVHAAVSLARVLASFANDAADATLEGIEKQQVLSIDIKKLRKHIKLYRATFMMDKYTAALPPLVTVPQLMAARSASNVPWRGSLLSLQDSYSLLQINSVTADSNDSAGYMISLYGEKIITPDILKKSNHIEYLSKYVPLYPYVIKSYDLVCTFYYLQIACGTNLPDCHDLNKSVDELLCAMVQRKGLRVSEHVYDDARLNQLAHVHVPDVYTTKMRPALADSPHSYFLDVHNSNEYPLNKLRLGIANMRLSERDCEANLQGRPNRSLKRYKGIRSVLASAAKQRVNMVLLPELSVPMEWLNLIAGFCLRERIAVVCGMEHAVVASGDDRAGHNLTAVLLPYTYEKFPYVSLTFHSKVYWAEVESKYFSQYGYRKISGNSFELFHWRDIWFPVYCCLELASITDRARFQSYADTVLACEWNRDTNHFSNIIKSLARDLECYCCQANNSTYGDSRIVMPAKTELVDVVRVKGGENHTLLVGELDIDNIRQMQMGKVDNKRNLKSSPPGFDSSVARLKRDGLLARHVLENEQS